MRPALAAALLGLNAACAGPKPMLYPDEHFKSAGEQQAEKDVAECRSLAKAHVKANWKKPVGERSAWGAATGAVIGVATGLITGDLGRAAASGAAAGGAAGAATGAYDASKPDQVERAYVDRCLGERGYSVLGWR